VTAFGEELIVYFKALHGRFRSFLEKEKDIFYTAFSS
jgi:hypothetical protein